jgi:hypothetical protein
MLSSTSPSSAVIFIKRRFPAGMRFDQLARLIDTANARVLADVRAR